MISLTCDPRGKPAWPGQIGWQSQNGNICVVFEGDGSSERRSGRMGLDLWPLCSEKQCPSVGRPRHSRAGDTGVCSVCPGLTVVLVKLGPAVLMVSGSRVWGLSRDHRLPLSQTNKVYWMLEQAHSPGGQLWFQCLLCLRLVEFPRLALKRNCRLSVLYSES